MKILSKSPLSFSVDHNLLEDRKDVFYYKPEFIDLDKNIRNLKHEIKQIKDFSKVICGPFGSAIKVKDYGGSGIPLIRISNIDKNQELSEENTIYITEELAQKLKSYKVKKNDLIISQRGTLGLVVKISDFFDGGIISANFIAIKNIKGIMPDYLKIFLSSSYGKAQLLRKTSGQVQKKITTDDIKSLIIPIPLREIQNKIIKTMKSAYSEKRCKEQEVDKLLDSINNYVLDDLEIKLPELEDKMCFVVDHGEVKKERADTYYHQPKFKEVKEALEKGKYEIVKLGEVLKISGVLEDISKYDFINYVDIASIDKDFGIIENFKQVSSLDAPSRARRRIENGDLLLSSLKGSLKSIAIFKDNCNNPIASTGFFIIKNSYEYDNYYLWALFRSPIYQILLGQITTGAIMPAINRTELKNLKIPIPPIEVQKKIAEEVKIRMKKAQEIKIEYIKIIEEAKNKVEGMILNC